MDVPPSRYDIVTEGNSVRIVFGGTWLIEHPSPAATEIVDALTKVKSGARVLKLANDSDLRWDSLLLSRVLEISNWCRANHIDCNSDELPEGVRTLLAIATTVSPSKQEQSPPRAWFDLRLLGHRVGSASADFLGFVGELHFALVNLLKGKSNTRIKDFFHFAEEAGPRALGIVSLISVLVGMILAYMGAIQLRQFGAEIYVANLVAIGMAREMAPLMTAIIMAGRTGAAYAAQLGTMQTNEEIDATRTLGISPMEFLITPRLLSLVMVMPLLVLYSNLLGIIGGGLVANGMGVSTMQYFSQVQGAIGWGDINAGLFKSLVFATLVGIAGCQAGIQCGRSSAAVGEATTTAVVRAIVYLIVADSILNVVYDKMGI